MILTLILGTTACSSSSHSGGGGGSENSVVSFYAKDITAMGSSITNQTKLKTAAINYVEEKLCIDLDTYDESGISLLAEETPKRSLEEKYDIATKLIARAELALEVLTEENVSEDNLPEVIEALKLAGVSIEYSASLDDVKGKIAGAKDGDFVDTIRGKVDEINQQATNRLDDVEFKGFVENSKGELGETKISFKTDKDGKIESIKIVDGYYDSSKTEEAISDGKKFTYVTNNDGETETFNYYAINMKGKEMGLKYSDFGDSFYQIEEYGENGFGGDIFSGGYDIMKVEKPSESMTFSGKAIATIRTNIDGIGGEDIETDNAKLVFDKTTGKETLNMNFSSSGWYNVEISPDKMMFTGNLSADKLPFEFKNKEVDFSDSSRTQFDVNYYGDGDAEEVIANFGYVEGDYEYERKSFTGVFGGKKTK